MSYWYCPNCKIELDGCHVTYEEKCEYCGSDVLSVPETISQEELDELIKAKADGRLVVLACKTEDTVFIVYAKKRILETIVDKRAWTDDDGYMLRTKEEWFKEKDIGKIVFLTREEAEKALEGLETRKQRGY